MDHEPTLDAETSAEHLTIIADLHCRAVLAHFQDAASEVATAEGLADELAKQDHGGPDPSPAELHHVTLPRLDDAGAIKYDARSNTARYQGHPVLETLLVTLADR